VIGLSQRPDNTQTHNRQTSMPPALFEPAVPPSERPLTDALDRTAQSFPIAQKTHSQLLIADCPKKPSPFT